MARKKQKLPFPVGCLATWLLLSSLILVGFAVVVAMKLEGREVVHLPKQVWTQFDKISRLYWIVPVCQGIVGLPAAIGLYAKKQWAYNLYTVINGFAIGLVGVAVVGRHELFLTPWLIIDCLIMIYMLTPGVRKVFT